MEYFDNIYFRYRRGDRVTYGGRTTPVYVVTRQRYETREVFGPLVQYLLQDLTPDYPTRTATFWADEADVHKVENVI